MQIFVKSSMNNENRILSYICANILKLVLFSSQCCFSLVGQGFNNYEKVRNVKI